MTRHIDYGSRTHRRGRRFCGPALVALFLLLLLPHPPLSAQSVDESDAPRVEVAFVLDTTGSMSGLLEGAKAKIWDIANLIVSADPTPDVRFGLIGYRDRGDEYVTRVFDLTDDIDAVYANLQGFVAAGGGDEPESVNQALFEALERLSWTPLAESDDDVLRVVFLVGDARPHMDYAQDHPYTETAVRAVGQGIVINTIQCGSLGGTQAVWQEIARLADGEYASIGQSGDVVVIATPFDEELAGLNREIGSTIVGYGRDEDRRRLEAYQAASEEAAPASAADRLGYNRSLGRVAGGGGDLVDAVASGEVDLDSLDDEELPEVMRGMSEEERAAYVQQQSQRRAELQARVDGLLAQRQSYVEAERRRMREEGRLGGFDAEVDRMIRQQAAGVGIEFR